MALALRMPFEYVLDGGDVVDWHVDPYKMLAIFNGIFNGKEIQVDLNKLDMESILRNMQEGS